MKKAMVFGALLFVCAGLFAQNVSLDQAVQTSAQAVDSRLPKGAKTAVLTFTSAKQAFSDYIIDELATALSASRNLQVIDRQHTDAIRKEFNIQFSGDVSDDEVKRIGHQLGAQYVVTGSLVDIGNAYRFRVAAINIESAVREGASSLNININDPQVVFLLTGQRPTQTANTPNNSGALKYDSENDFRITPLSNGTVRIIGYIGTKQVIAIPPRINGMTVTEIGEGAFKEKQIYSITLPDTLISIGNNALSQNQLTSVTIPNRVISIGIGAFANNQLTSVTIGNRVASIGSGAFSENRLTRVIIPNSVTSLDGFSSNQLTSVTIPNSVTSLAGFNNNKLTSVTIPNSVTSIGDYAFDGNQLTSVTIPNSVTSIGFYAFSSNRLTSVIIPNRLTAIAADTFSHNRLTNIIIPNRVTAIEYRAFTDNQIASITIGANVAIDEQVFEYGFTDFYKSTGSNAGSYWLIGDNQWGLR